MAHPAVMARSAATKQSILPKLPSCQKEIASLRSQ
jgi:hypothetical protein